MTTSPSSLEVSLVDLFDDDRPCGSVIGTPVVSGVLRRGIDREGVIGIDHQALRIRPLIQPGWARSGIAYGPYPRVNGLMFAAAVLNGHHASQTGSLPDDFASRIKNMLRGSRVDPLDKRLARFIQGNRTDRLIRQMRQWAWAAQNPTPEILENLAVGWFSCETPDNPSTDGNAFIIHALGPQNGALWVRSSSGPQPVISGLQNLPIWYIVILREHGAAYYAASLPGAYGLSPYPELRPLGIDPFQEDTVVYGGVHQSVSGQPGFQVDTRVYGVQVEHLAKYANWYGSAHAADRLTGDTLLAGSSAEIGGRWQVLRGSLQRSLTGISGIDDPAVSNHLAILDSGVPSGLIHAVIACEPGITSAAGLLWRFQDIDNHWRVKLDDAGASLERVEEGIPNRIAQQTDIFLAPGAANSLQVVDDGETFCLFLNGTQLFNTWFKETWLGQATAVGISIPCGQGSLRVRDFETHPRRLPLPENLQLPAPWLPQTATLVDRDDFQGAQCDLHGCQTGSGRRLWQRVVGKGSIEISGSGYAHIGATVENPNPGRTAYTIAWDQPEFADLSLEIMPPSSDQTQGEKCRAGLIFWQDPDNYIIINTRLNGDYAGASISSFFYLDGYEDIYEAVRTHIGHRITWGVAYRLRTAFDGLNYLVYVNDEPVLFRALSDVYPAIPRLAINRVGIAANWEWGNDTGSILRSFEARQ